MDNYTIYLLKASPVKKYNITQLCGDLAWNDSVDNLAMEFSLSFARNTADKYIAKFDIVEAEDKLVIFNNDIEVFRGIITDVDWQLHSKQLKCMDYAFYLNKNDTIIQFRKINASKAIQQVCAKFNIKVDVPALATSISKIYKDNTVSEIITDILTQVFEETGRKYFYEMYRDTLHIRAQGYTAIVVSVQTAVNGKEFSIADAIGNISKSESIAEKRNSILVTSGDEKSVKVIGSAKDAESIKRAGLMQEVMSVDDKDKSKATNIAKNKLKELNKVTEELTIEVLGNDRVKCGRLIYIDVPEYKAKGKYLIKSSSHTYTNRIHKCSINIEKWRT